MVVVAQAVQVAVEVAVHQAVVAVLELLGKETLVVTMLVQEIKVLLVVALDLLHLQRTPAVDLQVPLLAQA
jgi:hypothetical protein